MASKMAKEMKTFFPDIFAYEGICVQLWSYYPWNPHGIKTKLNPDNDSLTNVTHAF